MNQEMKPIEELGLAILGFVGLYARSQNYQQENTQFAISTVHHPATGSSVFFGITEKDVEVNIRNMKRIVLHGEKPPFETNGSLMFLYGEMKGEIPGPPDKIALFKPNELEMAAVSIYHYLTTGVYKENLHTPEELEGLLLKAESTYNTVH